MRPFELLHPKDLAQACGKAAPDTAFKASGIDLLDRLKERVESPGTLIDLSRLRAELGAYEVKDGQVTLGALLTLTQIAEAKELQGPAYAALTEAARAAATPQIRNRATLGGNLLQKARCWYLRSAAFACAHSGKGPACLALTGEHRYHSVLGWSDCLRVHPSNLAPALLAFGAQALIQGAKAGTHNKALADVFPKEPTAAKPEHTLAADEVLMFVQFPQQGGNVRSAYRESREKLSFDWPTTAAAVRLELDGRRITGADVVLGAVAPVPVVATEAAALLRGKQASRELFEECAKLAYRDARPLALNGYKVAIGRNVLVEALLAASETK
jgi:xanthine dehydrogenase YagS FAD-binding subunit